MPRPRLVFEGTSNIWGKWFKKCSHSGIQMNPGSRNLIFSLAPNSEACTELPCEQTTRGCSASRLWRAVKTCHDMSWHVMRTSCRTCCRIRIRTEQLMQRNVKIHENLTESMPIKPTINSEQKDPSKALGQKHQKKRICKRSRAQNIQNGPILPRARLESMGFLPFCAVLCINWILSAIYFTKAVNRSIPPLMACCACAAGLCQEPT